MNKYYLFELTNKGISSAIINNIILSGIDLDKIDTISYEEFLNITGVKGEDIYYEIILLKNNSPSLYNIFSLTSCGISTKICQGLKDLGITYLFMLELYPNSLLKQRFHLTDNVIQKIKDAINLINEEYDKENEIVKEYLESLYNDKEYMNLLKRSILKNLNDEYILEEELEIMLDECYRHGVLIDKALEELSELEFVESSLFGIKKLQANLKEFIFNLQEDKNGGLLKDYLEGVPLNKLSLDYGIPQEKIKANLQKYTFPDLMEDEYLDIYQSYHLNINEFSKIFQIDKQVFRYLELKSKRPLGKRNILEMLEDDRVSDDVKVNIQNTLGKYAKIHGISVLKTPQDILDVYARFNMSGNLPIKNLYREFRKYWYSLFHEELPVVEAKFEKIVDQSKVIVEGKEGFRYYNTLVIDPNFYHLLKLNQYVDIEISCKIIFDANQSLMKAYGILDEYELFFILKKTYRKNDIEFIRKPIIVFGSGNRNNQIKSILFELSPVTMAEFTKAYSKAFGVNEKSFSNYAAKQFSPYYSNGVFRVNTPVLKPEILEMYKNLLHDDFYFIQDIASLAFKEGIPFQEYYFNKEMLKELGYKDGIRLIYKDTYSSLKDYIETLFKDEIYLNRIDPKLLSLKEFNDCLEEKVSSYSFVEIEPMHYVSINKLYQNGVTRELLVDFIDVVKGSVYEDEVFTIRSLRNKGFKHPLLDKGLTDYFYASIFYPKHEVITQKCYSTDYIILKTRVQNESISIASLIEQIVESKYYMYLPDIVKDLKVVYGITLNETQIKLYITLTNIYCNPDTMLYYLNYETYNRMR